MGFVSIIKNDPFLLETVRKIDPLLLKTVRKKSVSKCEAVKHFWNNIESSVFRNYLSQKCGFNIRNTRMVSQVKDAIVVIMFEYE